MERDISRVAVVGTGQMGPGIAVALALAGCKTTLVGRAEESLARGRQTFETALGFLVAHDAVTEGEADAARQQLRTTTRLEDVVGADVVIESIVEHLPTKQEFFRGLDELCPADTILASNTSGLRISDIAALTRRPERTVTTHFWNPAHLMPLVEVIRGERTAPETVQTTASFLCRCGKQPVVGNKDLPGQVCNRLFQAVIREAIYLVQEGIASVEDVEAAVKAGMGLRFPVYGPLEHLDAVGLDLGLAVQASVLPSLCNSPEPGRFLQDRVAAGDLGARTGRGFYDWGQRSVADLRRERDDFLVERLRTARRSAG